MMSFEKISKKMLIKPLIETVRVPEIALFADFRAHCECIKFLFFIFFISFFLRLDYYYIQCKLWLGSIRIFRFGTSKIYILLILYTTIILLSFRGKCRHFSVYFITHFFFEWSINHDMLLFYYFFY